MTGAGLLNILMRLSCHESRPFQLRHLSLEAVRILGVPRPLPDLWAALGVAPGSEVVRLAETILLPSAKDERTGLT